MLDEPPNELIEAPIEARAANRTATEILAPAEQVTPHLPRETRPDGSVIIDLSSLLVPPVEACLGREPDPFNPEIVVCRKVEASPRLGADYGPSAAELTDGSAVPRARVRLSEDAEAEANVTNNAVGGWNANGGEVRAKIKF